jgi:hypothetical protein
MGSSQPTNSMGHEQWSETMTCLGECSPLIQQSLLRGHLPWSANACLNPPDHPNVLKSTMGTWMLLIACPTVFHDIAHSEYSEKHW